MRRAIIALLITGCLLVAAVDRSKFKKCSDSSFCTRNRELSQRNQNNIYSVDSTSFQRVDSSKFQGTLRSPHLPADDKRLSLELSAIKSNIVRLRIVENHEKRFKGPEDALVPFSNAELQAPDNLQQPGKKVFTLGDDVRVELTYEPFRLDFFVGGEHVISTNDENMLNFEHIRTKEQDSIPHEIADPGAQKPSTWDDESDGVWEAPKVPNPAVNGRWEETFSSHRDSKLNGPTSIGLDFSFINSKHVYGIPEHADSHALKATKRADGSSIDDPYRLYNLDVFEYELNNGMALYGSVPLMLSHTATRTTGVFWLNSAETWIDITETHEKRGKPTTHTQWFSESGVIDVFFLLGPKPYDIFQQYATLTGGGFLPPLFSIGYHQCKWNYKDEREVYEVDDGFDTWDIPMDVIWLDIEHTQEKKYFTWDPNHFPDSKRMLNAIADKGRKMVTIIDPHIKRDSGYHIHTAASAAGDLYVKNNEGREYEGHCWPGGSSWIDYTSAKARQWWADKFAYNVYEGSTPTLYVWNDMNEPSVFNGPEVTMHKDALHQGGIEHREVHNIYGMYMHMATAQGLIDRNPSRNERPFVLSRAFFAGSQRTAAIWTGDNAAQWEHLAIAQPMLLTLGISGIVFSGADVGGFFGNPEPELLTRWYQAAAFHPFYRGHAHLDSKRREPWLMGEPYVQYIKEAIQTKYSYLPYWYTLFYQNTQTGKPLMRPLWVEFPEDTAIFAEQDEFLVGDSLLVKPVTKKDQNNVEVYLPGSQPWFDVSTGKKHDPTVSTFFSDPRRITVDAPLSKMIPVFQRGGTIVPKKERARRSTTQMADDEYTLVVALNNAQEATGELYADDGHSYDYLSGKYLHRRFVFANNKLSSTAVGEGKFAATNTVEKIVVFGLQKLPVKILGESNRVKFELRFVQDGDKLIVRKPDFSIANDWSITFVY